MPKNNATGWDDWLEETSQDEGYDSYADMEEAIAYGDWEWDHRREYIYPTEEVAWLEWFSVDQMGPVWQATCREDGTVFTHPVRAKAIHAVRTHVERGHRDPEYLRPTRKAFTGEPPF